MEGKMIKEDCTRKTLLSRLCKTSDKLDKKMSFLGVGIACANLHQDWKQEG
jgi:hypothetical protein